MTRASAGGGGGGVEQCVVVKQRTSSTANVLLCMAQERCELRLHQQQLVLALHQFRVILLLNLSHLLQHGLSCATLCAHETVRVCAAPSARQTQHAPQSA